MTSCDELPLHKGSLGALILALVVIVATSICTSVQVLFKKQALKRQELKVPTTKWFAINK